MPTCDMGTLCQGAQPSKDFYQGKAAVWGLDQSQDEAIPWGMG